MSDANRSAGRPSSNIDAREKLIHFAKELFTIMPYEKVSTRLIANKAGVNVAMIRYYFGNKEGLFETMLRETMSPMKQRVQSLVRESSQENFLGIMRTYYQEMNKVPHFPRLIAQVMHMPPSDTQRKLLEKVIEDVTGPMQNVIFDKLVESGVLKADVDPQLCKISYISLMVFPFMAPPSMLSLHGIELNEEFLNRLIEHNIQLMKHGFLEA